VRIRHGVVCGGGRTLRLRHVEQFFRCRYPPKCYPSWLMASRKRWSSVDEVRAKKIWQEEKVELGLRGARRVGLAILVM
jgi:hypothetical protein